MPADDVPDSTDWLSTPLNGFAAVEAALRCQVCKDFYTTPVITSCSHTFCSLCIRRALSNDGRCPLCRAADQELKLRSNWSMEETVESFTKVRASALELARNQMLATRSPKRKAEDAHPAEAHVAPEPKRLRTSARLNRSYSTLEQASPEIPQEVEDVIEASDDDEYVPDNREFSSSLWADICQYSKLTKLFFSFSNSRWPRPLPRLPTNYESMASIQTFGNLPRTVISTRYRRSKHTITYLRSDAPPTAEDPG